MTGFNDTEYDNEDEDDNEWLTSKAHFLLISNQVYDQYLTVTVFIQHRSDQRGIQFKLHSMLPEAQHLQCVYFVKVLNSRPVHSPAIHAKQC